MSRTEETTSRCVGREPCPKCGSSDNLARYDDGHAYCFTQSCGYYEPGTEDRKEVVKVSEKKLKNVDKLVTGEVPDGGLPARKLTEETCRKYGYWIGRLGGESAQIANYRNEAGQVYLQKLRFKDKSFTQLGDTSEPGLFGQHLWNRGGRRLVITEGEIDAMSVAQVMNLKWPVVSIKNGASGAVRDIQKSIDFVSSFEAVVICFDNDKPGREAAKAVAEILPPGKAHIAELPLKDANEMLVAGKGADIIRACWEARPYRPDGVVSASDIFDRVMVDAEDKGVPWPFNGLNEKLQGIRTSEIVTFTMGSGVGKSTICRQIAYYLHMSGHKVGMLMLEETVARSAKLMLGLHMRQRLHLNPAPPEEMRKAWLDMYAKQEVVFYDHFGSTEIDNLLNRIRYMSQALGCKYVVLDHLSIAVSGLEGGDERRDLDLGMTKLRQLVQELDICLFLVVHLKRPSGDKGFEQAGMRPRLNHIRGSQGIAQLSDAVITGGRGDGGLTNIWVEKNRVYGEIHGDDDDPVTLSYDKVTGWFSEVKEFDNEESDDDEEGKGKDATSF